MTAGFQRLCLTFACDDEIKYISHLDLMRTWERALKRAALPLAYSQGFTPRPRFALAAPLAVGFTSECELLELTCREQVPFDRIRRDLPPQLPRGLRLLDVQELASDLPALPSRVRAAEYRIDVADDRSDAQWRAAVDALLARPTISWEHQRGDELRRYDLRPLILAIHPLTAAGGRAQLRLRLRHDASGAGRPEQVAKALGVPGEPLFIHRTQLELEQPSLAGAVSRTSGRRPD